MNRSSAATTARRLTGLVTALALFGLLVPAVALAADTAPPNATVTAPSRDQELAGSPVLLSGVATDDTGVGSVEVSVTDRATGLWLRPDGTFGSFARLPVALDQPEAPSTPWSVSAALPPGQYSFGVRAVDTSGKVDATVPWLRFSVVESQEPPPPADRPSVVLVLTDDQHFSTLSAMPRTKELILDRGVTFDQGFAVDPLCCPSRASLLKGAYPHSTGVYQNTGPYGAAAMFDDTSTLATWLDGAGYETALVGKYLNGYDPTKVSYVPPGWDRWVAFATYTVGGGAYYDYTLSVDGTRRSHGATAADYSTDVLAGHAEGFIRSAPADRPLFLYFSPYGPHGPAIPAPRHADLFGDLAPYRPPSYDEADVTDKPRYVRNLPRVTPTTGQRMDDLRRNQYRSLQSVDEAVGRLVTALEETGRLDETMIVFASDNGFSWGEHRWGQTEGKNKMVPYEESARVPFAVRYDPVTTPGRTSSELVTLIDLAPTFTALAGTSAPGSEGVDLMPVLSDAGTPGRSDFLIEHRQLNDTGSGIPPSYCAVRSRTHLYVQYRTLEEELYDVTADPFQLANLAALPSARDVLLAMRERNRQLCQPQPPGFTFIAPDAVAGGG